MGFSGNSTLSLVLCDDLPGGVRGGKFKREGTYVYLWLIHAVVWQNPTQHCDAIILQSRINFKNKYSAFLGSEGCSGKFSNPRGGVGTLEL